MKRKPPTEREITSAAIAQLFNIDRALVDAMTTEQIRSLVQIDHDPVPVAVAIALGWGPEDYNHPRNLTLRLVADHLEKTRKNDIPAIAKSARVAPEHEAFRRKMLAKAGQTDESGVVQTAPKRKAKFSSRGFPKPPAGIKRGFGKRKKEIERGEQE